jgi:hypothetical protein
MEIYEFTEKYPSEELQLTHRKGIWIGEIWYNPLNNHPKMLKVNQCKSENLWQVLGMLDDLLSELYNLQ